MFALTATTSADIQYIFTLTNMFELSELKAKKLAELQEIAKELGIKKITALKKIELTYQDLKGKKKVEIFEGIFSVCVQHEIDNLEGKLMVDYLSPL